MTFQLYDLALADIEARPSPFCWIAKFALLHKGLDFETVPLRFAEKENYPDPEHARVPILKDGEEIICDSANIIAHLEKTQPDRALTASAGERAAAQFYRAWLNANFLPAIAPKIIPRVHARVHADDKDYFRKTREERFGKTLEELVATPGLKEKAEAALATLAAPLARYRFLGGDEPNLCDYIVMSAFMWQYVMTDEALYEAPQAVAAWRERMLDLFDGYGRRTKRAE